MDVQDSFLLSVTIACLLDTLRAPSVVYPPFDLSSSFPLFHSFEIQQAAAFGELSPHENQDWLISSSFEVSDVVEAKVETPRDERGRARDSKRWLTFDHSFVACLSSLTREALSWIATVLQGEFLLIWIHSCCVLPCNLLR